jgi:raffinose/stachyose/melibiose transport system permease protein
MISLARPSRLGGALRERPRHSLLRRMYAARLLYLLVLPTFILVGLFQWYPLLSGLVYAFYRYDGFRLTYIGLGNFEQMLRDPTLRASIPNIAVLVLARIAIALTVPLGVALLIYHLRSERWRYWYRVGYVLPMVVPTIVVYLLWSWIFDYNGVLNTLLRGLGLGTTARPWLGDSDLALPAIIAVGFPWVVPFNMLIYLAGLQNIPTEIQDASTVDGAVGLRRILLIELPLIRGQVRLLVILTFITVVEGFESILILTNGGPGSATMVPGLRLYQAAMNDYELGYATAIGLVLFFVLFAFTMLNLRVLRSDVQY